MSVGRSAFPAGKEFLEKPQKLRIVVDQILENGDQAVFRDGVKVVRDVSLETEEEVTPVLGEDVEDGISRGSCAAEGIAPVGKAVVVAVEKIAQTLEVHVLVFGKGIDDALLGGAALIDDLFLRKPETVGPGCDGLRDGLREKWCNRGVHSEKDLEKVLGEDRKVEECRDSLGKKRRKTLDDVDLEYIRTWMLTYKMEPDVPAFLYTYLRKDKDIEKVSMKQMDEILQEWFSHNIHTVDEAKNYELKKQAADRTQAMTTFCGELFRKRLDGPDLKIIEKWANTDCWEEPIVRFAYETLHKFMGTITLSAVDERLQLWKENGVASVTKAKQFEAEQKRKNKEAYQERKYASPAGASPDVTYMENEYTREHLDSRERESMDVLDALLKDE